MTLLKYRYRVKAKISHPTTGWYWPTQWKSWVLFPSLDKPRSTYYNWLPGESGIQGYSQAVKATDFDSVITLVQIQLSLPKIREQSSRIFHLCRRHNIICQNGNIISSEARTSLPLAAQMNDVEALPQMMWAYDQWCYGFAVNEVALWANGIRPFARFSTLNFFEIL